MNKTAYLLGLSGLIPFVGLTALMHQPWAITWGVAMRDPSWSNPWRLCLCMLPSLLGWLALALAHEAALAVLFAAYALWWLYDFSQLKDKSYRQLRRCLSLVVLVCHGSWMYFGV